MAILTLLYLLVNRIYLDQTGKEVIQQRSDRIIVRVPFVMIWLSGKGVCSVSNTWNMLQFEVEVLHVADCSYHSSINLLGFPIVEEIAMICPYDDYMGGADE
jgi:hypothetical protein